MLQNYLRNQPDNRTSADLVTLTVEYVACAAEELDADSVDLITQGLETLVEMADGCPGNQRAVFAAKVVDIVNTILRTSEIEFACNQQLNKVAHLKMVLAKLVMTMVEDTSPDAAKLAKVRARNWVWKIYFFASIYIRLSQPFQPLPPPLGTCGNPRPRRRP